MEKLLNKLIEKGRKPFGKDQKFGIWIETSPYKKIRVCLKKPDYDYYVYSYRELVSKESWLWQFCVKNRLVKEDDGHIARIINLYKSDESIVDGWWSYHYWLMICSILDESELEDFLIENIKV